MDRGTIADPQRVNQFAEEPQRYERAIWLMDAGRHEDADTELLKLLAADPEDVIAMRLRVRALGGMGRKQDALAQAQAVVAADPEYPDAFRALAVCLLTVDRPADALHAADQATALDPRSASSHATRSVALFTLKRREDALAAAEQALSIDPHHPVALEMRARTLGFLRRGDAAVRAAESTVQLNPFDADAHLQLGYQLALAGDFSPAREAFREALRIDPQLKGARVGYRSTVVAEHRWYRRLLHVNIWLALRPSVMWLLWVVLWFGSFGLSALTRIPAGLHVALSVPVLCALGVVFLTGTSDCLVALGDPQGRELLTRYEAIEALVMFAVFMVVFIANLVSAAVAKPVYGAESLILMLFAIMIHSKITERTERRAVAS